MINIALTLKICMYVYLYIYIYTCIKDVSCMTDFIKKKKLFEHQFVVKSY